MYCSFVNNANDSVFYMFKARKTRRMSASLESNLVSRCNFFNKSENIILR